jgi:flagellar hook-associated protein 2
MVTATTSTANTTAATTTSAKTAAAKIVSTLGAGSGVDVTTLASSLVDAEKAPRQAEINAKVTKAEGGISGYAAIKFVLGDVQTAFTNLKNQSSFNTLVPQISQPNAVSVTTTASATTGSHTISVTQLAQQQRSISADGVPGFDDPLAKVNSGNAFKLLLKSGINPTPTFVQTPAGSTPITSVNLTLKAMGKGDTVTVNGLTLTANKALSASEVGQMFENFNTTSAEVIAAGGISASSQNNATLANFGTFSGTFATGYSTGGNNNGVLRLTSTANNAAQLAAPVATQFSNTIAIAASASTPAGIAAAINTSNLGISAQLISTGNAATPYKIMITGASGANNAFSLTSLTAGGGAVSGVNFTTKLQSAEDAALNVNGMAITSSTNRITDAIPGTTLELFTTTNGAANLDFSRDTSTVKTKIQTLVTAFNDANSMLTVVSDPKSTVAEYGASLVGNNIVSTVRSQMRSLITTDSNSPSGGLAALRDIGLSINRSGTLELDAAKLDNAMLTKFDNVVTLLTSNQEKLSATSALPAGAAGEAVKKLTNLLDIGGAITTQSNNLTKKITDYQKELAALDTRMTALLTRYNKQFASMESIVGQSKSLQTSLKSTFEGMMSAYTNK